MPTDTRWAPPYARLPAKEVRLAFNRGDRRGHRLAKERLTIHGREAHCTQETRPHRLSASVSSGTAACVLLGGMTLAVPGVTGYVAPAQRAVIRHDSASRRPRKASVGNPK